MRERSSALVNTDLALRGVVESINKMMPALNASVARCVQACAIVARKLFVADITWSLAAAQLTVNIARSNQQLQPQHEEPMLRLLDKMRDLTAQPLTVPEILWPGSTSDVFAPPTLA
jgi:hypothetical protein